MSKRTITRRSAPPPAQRGWTAGPIRRLPAPAAMRPSCPDGIGSPPRGTAPSRGSSDTGGMDRMWYCRTCGYEVSSGGRCHSCGERLIESDLAELRAGEADDEVGYRLTEWDDDPRGQLIEALNTAGIHHRFEQNELVVAA